MTRPDTPTILCPFAPRWARSIAPETWRVRVMGLARPLRYAIARIVFWDMFPHQLASERTPAWDRLLRHADIVPDPELVAGLIAVGYPPLWAQRRIRTPKPRRPRK